MFCSHCGSELPQDSQFCPNCGAPQNVAARPTDIYGNPVYTVNNIPQQSAPPRPASEQDASNAGFAVLCFFFPIVGLILFLVWHDQYPKKARSCGMGALISVIISAVLIVLYIIFAIVIVGIAASSYYSLLPLIAAAL